MQPKTRNYLKRRVNVGQQQSAPGRFVRVLPDTTVHNSPGALLALGFLGVGVGILGNLWQPFTTFLAFWGMFNPAGSPVNLQKQPGIFFVCGVIALGAQFALLFLVFRIETPWKKHKVHGTTPGISLAGAKATAVELVQHVSMIIVWGLLGFVVDTIGDFKFIGQYTSSLDFATSTFLIFIYCGFLYAFTTVAFVKSIEYLWAGFAASDNLKSQRKQPSQSLSQSQSGSTNAGNTTNNLTTN